jgi:signal peptidase II
LKKLLQNYGLLALVTAIVLGIDQLTKYWVRTNLRLGEILFNGAWLTQYARIIHWQNKGAAFGMFQNLGAFFAILAVIVMIAILYYIPRVPSDAWLLKIALSMQFAGAAGNLIDRLFNNWHVTDFISVGSFAVFNIADASVFVGTLLLAYCIWIRDNKEKAAAEAGAESAEQITESIASAPLPEEPKGE